MQKHLREGASTGAVSAGAAVVVAATAPARTRSPIAAHAVVQESPSLP
jgi:hypothetical protein